MQDWIFIDIAVFLVVFAITGFIIPQILLIAFRKKLFDEVDPRKIHSGAVPRLGGIAFFPAILFSILLFFGLGNQFFPELLEGLLHSSFIGCSFIACAIIILYLVGMADDLVGLKYRAKFVAQILSAVLIVTGGINFGNLHGLGGVYDIPFSLAVVFTIFVAVFITNAINLIDGIDGLASGLSAIACAFYGFIFWRAGLHIYGILSFATLGVLVPFFYYNVFGNAKKHSKIFMGDTGALTIGLILSVLSIRITQIGDGEFSQNPVVMAFAPLLIPCFDVIRVYVHRLQAHRNPFLPDKSHIHHKMLAVGMNQKAAMMTIVSASVVLILLNYWLSRYINVTIICVFDIMLWIVSNLLLSGAIRRLQQRTGQQLYE